MLKLLDYFFAYCHNLPRWCYSISVLTLRGYDIMSDLLDKKLTCFMAMTADEFLDVNCFM